MTLMEVRHSDGRLDGRCDAKCYNSKGTKCKCKCKGFFHGLGPILSIIKLNNREDELTKSLKLGSPSGMILYISKQLPIFYSKEGI